MVAVVVGLSVLGTSGDIGGTRVDPAFDIGVQPKNNKIENITMKYFGNVFFVIIFFLTDSFLFEDNVSLHIKTGAIHPY